MRHFYPENVDQTSISLIYTLDCQLIQEFMEAVFSGAINRISNLTCLLQFVISRLTQIEQL